MSDISELVPHQKIVPGEQQQLSRTTVVLTVNHAPAGEQPKEMAVRRDMVSTGSHEAITRQVICSEGIPVPLPLFWIESPGLVVVDYPTVGTVNRDVPNPPTVDIIAGDGAVLFSIPRGMFAMWPPKDAASMRLVARNGDCVCRVGVFPE